MAPDAHTLLLTSAVLVTCFLFPGAAGSKHKKPNFLFILMTDMGWRDLGLRDPNFVTPTIDDMYNKAFRLDSAYGEPEGSSSRAALLSGRFSNKWGLQVGRVCYVLLQTPTHRQVLLFLYPSFHIFVHTKNCCL